MKTYRYSLAAARDLREIAGYTERLWGGVRRAKYLQAFDDAFAGLAARPKLGVARDELFSGLRSRQVGRHVVFYIANAQGILIIRVLHARMDPARHLTPS